MPQPVDLQTEVARATAVERIQQLADRVSLAARQRVASAAQEDRLVSETQVQQTPQAQSEEIDAEARRRNPYVGRRRRRKGDDNEDDAAKGPHHADEGEHCLDVTV